jgi:hypothetical protein
MLADPLRTLISDQSGVVARRQILGLGHSPAHIERLLRKRALVRILPGVYLNHTGEASWQQRAWAGVLYYHPAGLAHDSALRAESGPGWRGYSDKAAIQIAIDEDRHVKELDGYRLRRLVDLESKMQWNRSPPRLRIEEAGIDVAAERDTDFGAIEVLSRLCQGRLTTPARLITALEGRARLRRRSWLRDVLDDIAEGTCSVLEHGYLHRVERAHGLPRAGRQRTDRSSRGAIYRDAVYPEFDRYVELDGRLFHDSTAQRDLDLDRDLDASADGQATVRLGWGQVFERPCRTAARLERFLQSGGWTGAARECGPDCRLRRDVPVVATYQAR